MEVIIWVSYFEIYCGQLFDLLNKRKRLHVREDGSQRVNIAGLSEVELDNVQTLMEVGHLFEIYVICVSGLSRVVQ
jgi:kinesin family protein 2/24